MMLITNETFKVGDKVTIIGIHRDWIERFGEVASIGKFVKLTDGSEWGHEGREWYRTDWGFRSIRPWKEGDVTGKVSHVRSF